MSLTIHAAAAIGDADAVRRFLADDAALATIRGGPRDWDPLTCVCFSEHLRDNGETAGFVDAARALLDAGASANSGFHLNGEFESVLYGAAGVARAESLTRLLVERGADPNDGEVTYHAPESYDNSVLRVLIATGQLTPDSLATMLLRKCDWHDRDGVALLLDHGADPDRMTHWGYTALHQAIRRDNAIELVTLLLDHGADPGVIAHGRSAAARAAWEGRGDVLDLFERRGHTNELAGVDRLLAACATDDTATVAALSRDRGLVNEVISAQAALLGEFAGIGNVGGIRHLLDLGVDPATTIPVGDGYWGIARESNALHVAAWRARHETVRLLLERGVPVDVPDGNGRTPLMLAIRACVDSYWQERRSPDSVEALLAAGASMDGIEIPTGYPVLDVLLDPDQGK